MRIIAVVIIVLALSAIFATPAVAEEQYKKYTRSTKETALVELAVTPTEWTFSVFEDEETTVYIYDIAEIERSGGRIICGDEVELTDDGIQFPDYFISSEDIKRIDVKSGDGDTKTVLTFMAVDDDKKATRFKRKKGDRVKIFGETTVEADEFIRGSVVSFFGDISVFGEVNEDVVAVAGDIFIADGAVVRGDVESVSGKVTLDKNSSVFGTIKSSKGKSSTRRHRARKWKDYDNNVTSTGALYYNRVDGLTLWSGAKYDHADSIIPSFEATAGYAFASERWRYKVGLTQTVLRGKAPVQVGGQLFRTLASGDERLISESENSIFALLVNEDWKDYYESEGGYGFARMHLLGWNKFEVGYLSEKQRWYDANSHLWSVFGNKEFRGNFSSVPYDTLEARKKQFDDQQITSLVLDYSIDTRDEEKHPRRGWYGFARYEYSPEKWKGDFDFKRFETRLKRYQTLGRYVSLDLSAAYGYAEGENIPLSRMFYLGGLGTIHGYRHKELIGTEYVLISGEYRFRIPRSEVAPFVHYDGGRMMGERMTGEDNWNSSIGFGVDFERSIRIFVSKRLDKDDNDPVFYARFSAAIW